MSKTDNVTGWYANVFKHWPVKMVGAQPTATQLDTIHKLGARPGKQALANAMALRDGGVTGAQIVMACGAPQLNKMRGFVHDGLLRFVATPPSEAGHKVYKLIITAKGQAKVDRVTKAVVVAAANDKATAKPAKAKAAKATPAKATAAVTQAPQPATQAQPSQAVQTAPAATA